MLDKIIESEIFYAMIPDMNKNSEGMENLFLTMLDSPSRRKNTILLLLDMIPMGHHPLPYIERIHDPVSRFLLRENFQSSLNDMKLKYDLMRYVQKSKKKYDLKMGSFLISRLSDNTEITPEIFSWELNRLALALKPELEKVKTAEEKMKYVILYFLHLKKFKCRQEDRCTPESSFLTHVLKTGDCNADTFAVLWILIGTLSGLKFFAVAVQEKLFLTISIEGKKFFIDPCDAEMIYTDQDFQEFLSCSGIRFHPDRLPLLSEASLLKRIYRNLIQHYSREGNFHKEMILRQHVSILEDSSMSQ